MPPSLPKYPVPSAAIAIACWSGCVVIGQVLLAGLGLQQASGKFQYGPITFHVAPASVVSKTSSRPRYTCRGFFGSTWTYWSYHAWLPGSPPDLARAEPASTRVCSSATCLHGPAGSPDGERNTPPN